MIRGVRGCLLSVLLAIADLGRELVRENTPVEDVAKLHEMAMRRLAADLPQVGIQGK